MKLQARFIQLPIAFDAERLAEEIAQLGEDAWRPHPEGFKGNDFLPLISAHGDPANEAFGGPMRPTPHLERCPYLVDTLATLGASLGRTRLMRLAGQAEVQPHVDVNYYWRDRMRVHVPIITQPTVAFICGGVTINMKAGECWIFDTWSLHRVLNDATRSRIHLVADTVGGEQFWNHVVAGRAHGYPASPTWAPRMIAPFGASVSDLDLETVNVPKVMSPWEASEHIKFLLSEADPPNQPTLPAVTEASMRFLHTWRSLWSTFGESEEGWPRYGKALAEYNAALKAAQAHTVRMSNGAPMMNSLSYLVLSPALQDKTDVDNRGEQRMNFSAPAQAQATAPRANGAAPRLPSEPDPIFERPIFIVNPPRSGSSMLFETLAQAPGLYTVGGESHGIIEGVQAFNMNTRNFDSNRLTAADAKADPAAVEALRMKFASVLRDREGQPPSGGRVRMLEKTPKNALRIPFLAAAFPEARFIYLYRDPREVLSSMMEAWESGRFRTYPDLPGWQGKRVWSLLLTPGWRDLAKLELSEIVSAQWKATTQILLDDLEKIPADRRTTTHYDALVADPGAEIRRICEAMEIAWDRQLNGALPLARHTVSVPKADKWRAREPEIAPVLPAIAAVMDRAQRAAAR